MQVAFPPITCVSRSFARQPRCVAVVLEDDLMEMAHLHGD